MSLRIDATTEGISVPAGAELDDLQTCTYLAWVYVDTGSTERKIFQKGYVAAHGTYGYVSLNLTASLFFESYSDRVTDLGVAASFSNFGAWGTGKWVFCVAQQDYNTASNCRLFIGDASTPAAEPSSYSVQTNGSGSHVSDSGSPLYIGQRGNNAHQLNGNIAFAAAYNRVLSQAEIRAIQRNPRLKLDGCVLHMFPGIAGASASQPDYSGYGNHGTIMGSPTVAAGHPVYGLHGRRHRRVPYVVAAGPSFQPAWAARSTILLQAGIGA